MRLPPLPRRLALVLSLYAALFCWRAAATAQAAQPAAPAAPSSPAQANILDYIHRAWDTLRRSMNECSSIADPKFGNSVQPVLYLPHSAAVPPEVEKLQTEYHVRLERLPHEVTHLGAVIPSQLPAPGLLFLPDPYVVPGGRFNEMYGWDSYFIIRGLLEDGRRELARGMMENFFYEIENYGAVLNANRTYYLTRSQPPFLTSMVMALYAADKAARRPDLNWLARAYHYSERDYALWTHAPKLAGHTGLSRYFDVGEGPVPEIADHPEYYVEVADWLVRHLPPQQAQPRRLPGTPVPPQQAQPQRLPGTPVVDQVQTGYLAPKLSDGIGPELRVPLCAGKPCPQSRTVRFTADYYKGDRAMRESGFDVTFRFGPFGGLTHHYAPVCLNSLLYKAETDLAEMARLLGYSEQAREWRARVRHRKKLVNRYFWNPAKGMYFDYDFETRQQSTYEYATTFYPLWVGLATPKQAKAVLRKLPLFENPGGLAMSTYASGVQWDKPYGWAPVELIAVEAMRRYGFRSEAGRVSNEFLTTVIENYRRDGTIREKYNVVTRATQAKVTAGYQTNVVGFGWTNAAFLLMLHALPAEEQKNLLAGER
ncbi:MAG: trehalase family glycosidase [Candidatus Korobacteraceae bacterium]